MVTETTTPSVVLRWTYHCISRRLQLVIGCASTGLSFRRRLKTEDGLSLIWIACSWCIDEEIFLIISLWLISRLNSLSIRLTPNNVYQNIILYNLFKQKTNITDISGSWLVLIFFFYRRKILWLKKLFSWNHDDSYHLNKN